MKLFTGQIGIQFLHQASPGVTYFSSLYRKSLYFSSQKSFYRRTWQVEIQSQDSVSKMEKDKKNIEIGFLIEDSIWTGKMEDIFVVDPLENSRYAKWLWRGLCGLRMWKAIRLVCLIWKLWLKERGYIYCAFTGAVFYTVNCHGRITLMLRSKNGCHFQLCFEGWFSWNFTESSKYFQKADIWTAVIISIQMTVLFLFYFL